MNKRAPAKQAAMLRMMEDGWVSLYLDARHPEVVVPEAFVGNPQLVLEYGYDQPIPIVDLQIGRQVVAGTMSFNRVPHVTIIPWDAVYVIKSTTGEHVFYPEDVPHGVPLGPPRLPPVTKSGPGPFSVLTAAQKQHIVDAVRIGHEKRAAAKRPQLKEVPQTDDTDLDVVSVRPSGPPTLRVIRGGKA